MKKIEVKDQVYLGPKRCLDLSVAAMSYRIARSTVTIMILALAVAFLAYILYYGILQHDSEYHAYKLLQKERLMGKWVNRLTVGDGMQNIRYNFARNRTDRIKEYADWAELSSGQVEKLSDIAVKLQRWNEYFESVSLTDRTILLGEQGPGEFLANLVEGDASVSRFLSQMEEMKMKPVFETRDSTRHFIQAQAPVFFERAREFSVIQDSINRTIEAIIGEEVMAAMHDPDVDLFAVLNNNGYLVSQEDVARMKTQAQVNADFRLLGDFISRKRIAPRVAKKMNVEIANVNTAALINWMNSKGKAQWIHELMQSHAQDLSRVISTASLREMAQNYKKKAKLQDIVTKERPEKREHVFALSPKMLWLILVSFVVCLVGITNTMLMSVTERFGEIATMKCIGAMDGFVMIEFVFEAIIQGIVGSVVGIIIGFALALIRGMINYGFFVFETLPWADLIIISVISFFTGIIISAISATGPSWTASKLAPMEAMRVE